MVPTAPGATFYRVGVFDPGSGDHIRLYGKCVLAQLAENANGTPKNGTYLTLSAEK